MTSFGHNFVGATIALTVVADNLPTSSQDYILIVILGIISHYLTDAIPHGHYRHTEMNTLNTLRTKVLPAADFIISFTLILTLVVASGSNDGLLWPVVVGMLAAELPDLIELALEFRLLPRTKALKRHRHFHWHTVHWHNRPSQMRKAYPTGRAWSVTDVWQLIPISIFVIEISS